MLNFDQIELWYISLKVTSSELQKLELLLAKEEKARADRFKFDIHRHHFIAARANLRIILSHYLSLPSQEIEFSYSPKGKPFLNDYQNLEFNLSHSQDLAVCAVTENSVLGIDLEYFSSNQRDSEKIQNIAERFLSKTESEIIQASASKSKIFYKIWTAKEAYLKATGCGLGKLEEVSTLWENGEIIGIAVNQVPLDWMIYQLIDSHDYIISVASPVTKAIAFQANLK
jgi:4'-phosphopantetheinyl transferase